jgi:hypothetical protein
MRMSTDSGISMPSAFAVLRLTMSSTLTACCTGRSAGFGCLYKDDELAAFHSITSSANAMSLSGICSPRILAVRWFHSITSSARCWRIQGTSSHLVGALLKQRRHVEAEGLSSL